MNVTFMKTERPSRLAPGQAHPNRLWITPAGSLTTVHRPPVRPWPDDDRPRRQRPARTPPTGAAPRAVPRRPGGRGARGVHPAGAESCWSARRAPRRPWRPVWVRSLGLVAAVVRDSWLWVGCCWSGAVFWVWGHCREC